MKRFAFKKPKLGKKLVYTNFWSLDEFKRELGQNSFKLMGYRNIINNSNIINKLSHIGEKNALLKSFLKPAALFINKFKTKEAYEFLVFARKIC